MMNHIYFDRLQNALVLLDQRYLPGEENWFVCKSVQDTVEGLEKMVIRGAPAIGITAAFGCYLAACEQEGSDNTEWTANLNFRLNFLSRCRPTAVNLRWAVEFLRSAWNKRPQSTLSELKDMWLDMAEHLLQQDVQINREIGKWGQKLLYSEDRVMTHCNAGALATGGYGTALGVIRGAVERGKKIFVIVNETRPFFQGSRLTAYELQKDKIPVRVACDSACGLLMRRGLVNKVVVGADRVAANGDVANKIGTYTLAIAAQEHGIPFYVAAPRYSFDLFCESGESIPIEERVSSEVTHIGDNMITPSGVEVLNYAFDITPAKYITAFITEEGVFYPPYKFWETWGEN